MSAEYMRKLIESVELAQLNEDPYDDRVQRVADRVNSDNPDGVYPKERQQAIVQAAQTENAVEIRGSEQARRDFIKDVAKLVKTRRDTRASTAKKERVQKVLDELYQIAQDAIGMGFPDGDPIDHIIPKALKMGVPAYDVGEWLDRAFKKHEGVSYHDFLKMLWDDQYTDAKSDLDHLNPSDKYYSSAKGRYDMLGGDNYKNPWS